jgi:hypothetical protein
LGIGSFLKLLDVFGCKELVYYWSFAMYPKTPTGKSPKGAVQIITSHDRLQLRFRHLGKRHYVSIGLSDNPTNCKVAEIKARQIELDIASGNFDETLNKYKPQSAFSVAEEEIIPNLTPITLGKLWEKGWG